MAGTHDVVFYHPVSTFENFVTLYLADVKGCIKENTWGTKEHILYKKLVPYFGKKMCDIHSKEVIAWQNEMLDYRDKNGKPYSPVYLKTLHNQLSAVFNHAVEHYNLTESTLPTKAETWVS